MDQLREQIGTILSSIWEAAKAKGCYDIRKRVFSQKKSKLSPDTMRALCELFPRELDNGHYKVVVCTFRKLIMGMSHNPFDTVFNPERASSKYKEALIIDEFDRLYQELLEAQVDKLQYGIPVLSLMDHVLNTLEKYLQEEAKPDDPRYLELKEIRKLYAQTVAFAEDNGLADKKADGTVVYFPQFSKDNSLFQDQPVVLTGHDVYFLSDKDVRQCYYVLKEGAYGQAVLKRRKKGQQSAKKGEYPLDSMLHGSDRVLNQCIRLARIFKNDLVWRQTGNESEEWKEDRYNRSTAADMIGARADSHENESIASAIFSPFPSGRNHRPVRSERPDHYAYGDGFYGIDCSPAHAERIELTNYRISLLPSYLMRCMIAHFEFVCGMSATLTMQGVHSFNLSYIGRDYDGNDILARMPHEDAMQIEKMAMQAKGIIYGDRGFHSFLVPGCHSEVNQPLLTISNPETGETVLKDLHTDELKQIAQTDDEAGGNNDLYSAVSICQAASVWMDHHIEGGLVFAVTQKAGTDSSHLKIVRELLERMTENSPIRDITSKCYFGTVRAGNVSFYNPDGSPIPAREDAPKRLSDGTMAAVYRDKASLDTDDIDIHLKDSHIILILLVPEENMRGYNYSYCIDSEGKDGSKYNLSGMAVRKSTYILDDIRAGQPNESMIRGLADYINMGVLSDQYGALMKEFRSKLSGTGGMQKEPAALRNSDMSPYKMEQDIRIVQTIGRLRMNDPGHYPMVLIDQDIVTENRALLRETQFTSCDDQAPYIMKSYETEQVLESVDEFRQKQMSSEERELVNWNQRAEQLVSSNIHVIADAKESKDRYGIRYAIRQQETLKLAVCNPLSLRDDNEEDVGRWIREQVPDALDVSPEDVKEMSDILFRMEPKRRLSIPRTVTVINEDYCARNFFNPMEVLFTFNPECRYGFQKRMPFLVDEYQKWEVSGVNLSKRRRASSKMILAAEQGATSLLGEFGEVSTQELFRTFLSNPADQAQGFSIVTSGEKQSNDFLFFYEDCDLWLRPDVMVDVKNYSHARILLSPDAVVDRQMNEARNAFINKVKRFPDNIHVTYIYFMPFLPGAYSYDNWNPLHRFTAESSRYVEALCRNYGKDFEIITVSGVLPRQLSDGQDGWKEKAAEVIGQLFRSLTGRSDG